MPTKPKVQTLNDFVRLFVSLVKFYKTLKFHSFQAQYFLSLNYSLGVVREYVRTYVRSCAYGRVRLRTCVYVRVYQVCMFILYQIYISCVRTFVFGAYVYPNVVGTCALVCDSSHA